MRSILNSLIESSQTINKRSLSGYQSAGKVRFKTRHSCVAKSIYLHVITMFISGESV